MAQPSDPQRRLPEQPRRNQDIEQPKQEGEEFSAEMPEQDEEPVEATPDEALQEHTDEEE